MREWMCVCVCLCLSINDQLTSNESTHSIHSPFITCWPSLNLGLAPHISLHHYTDQSQRRIVEGMFGAHLRCPPQILLPNYRHNPLSVPPGTPLSPRYRYYMHNLMAELSHPTQARLTKPDNPLSLVVLDLSSFTFIELAQSHQLVIHVL